jgi:cytochrome c oxidase subunit 4
MSEQNSSPQHTNLLSLWVNAGLVWLGLLALFALNVFLAYIPIASVNVAVHMPIAMIMVVILVLFFMDFKDYTALLRLAAIAGVFWLLFMFVLTANDYFTRQ